MKKLVLILVLLFGVCSVSFAMGSAPSAQAGNAQVEEAEFIPRPTATPKVATPKIIRKAVPAPKIPGVPGATPAIVGATTVTVNIVGFDTTTYTGRASLNDANVLVTDNNPDNPTKIAEGISDTSATLTFNLTEGNSYWFSAVRTGYKPQFHALYTVSSTTPSLQLNLMRLNPFTMGMMATARSVKIRVIEAGYPTADPHPIAGAKVYLTRRVGDRIYGVETTTGADGYIPAAISVPYEADYGIEVFASGFEVQSQVPSPEAPYAFFADTVSLFAPFGSRTGLGIHLKRLLLP